MTTFIQISQFVLIISILVILHELGHFIPAKLFKTKVEKFYLFFDYKFSLFKKKIGDTVYGIGWIPFGGYVKISGMIDESMDKEQMKKPPQPWEFRSKPAWQRFIIMIGGVTVNFLLAWFIYSALLVTKGDSYIDNNKLEYGVYVDEIGNKLGIQKGDKVLSVDGKTVKKFDNLPFDILLGDEMTVNRNGKEVTFELKDEAKRLVLKSQGKNFIVPAVPPIIDSILPNKPASKANIKRGDLVTTVNGKQVRYWNDMVDEILSIHNDSIALTLKRGNELIDLTIFVPDSTGIGVAASKSFMNDMMTTDKYSVLQSIPKGLYQTVDVLIKQVRQFKLIFNKKVRGYEEVKGPIGIVTLMSPTWDWMFIWKFTAMFSVWLAFLNLLPIPALDGGHIVFLLYEMVTGRPATEKVLEIAQIIGFVIIMGLMILVFGNDIYNLIFK